MTLRFSLGLAFGALAALPVHAQAVAASGNVFPASFFAANQPATALDIINRVPGFTLDNGESVRGFTDSAGNVLINGKRPTAKNDTLATILSRISASRVVRIELVRGGAAGVDMLGKTVLANVVLKNDESTTGSVSLSDIWASDNGRQAPHLKLELTQKNGDTVLEGAIDAYRGFDDTGGHGQDITRTSGGQPLRSQAYNLIGYVDNLGATGAVATPLLGGSLRFNTQVAFQRLSSQQHGDDLALPPTENNQETDRQNLLQGEFGVTYDRDLSAAASLDTLAIQRFDNEDYKSLYRDQFEVDDFFERHHDGESIVRSTLTYKWSDRLSAVTGVEGAYNWLNSDTRYKVNSALVLLPAANVRVRESRGEMFARMTWAMAPTLTLEAGLRLEASRLTSRGDVAYDRTLVYPKPRLVLTWSPTPQTQVRARVEHEVSQLDFANFTAISSLTTGQVFTGNPTLSPQEAIVSEITYDRRFLQSGEFVLTYRHSALTDVIDRAIVTNGSGVFEEPANIGQGSEDDVVASLDLPIDLGFIKNGHLSASHTWRISHVTDPTTHRGRTIGGLSPDQGAIEFYQDLPYLHATWGVKFDFGSQQKYYSYNLVETDERRPFLSIYTDYAPSPKLKLRIEVNSIGLQSRRTLDNFAGTRFDAVPASVDARNLTFGPALILRLRREF